MSSIKDMFNKSELSELLLKEVDMALKYIDEFLKERVADGRYLVDLSITGNKINDLYITASGSLLLVTFGRYNSEDFYFAILRAVGDCCSSSWIEQIAGINRGIIEYISVVEMKNEWIENNEEKLKKFDVLEQYCWRIKTHIGDIDIELRNDSNGYYGGELVWLESNQIGVNTTDELFAKISDLKVDRDHYPIRGIDYHFNLTLKDIIGDN